MRWQKYANLFNFIYLTFFFFFSIIGDSSKCDYHFTGSPVSRSVTNHYKLIPRVNTLVQFSKMKTISNNFSFLSFDFLKVKSNYYMLLLIGYNFELSLKFWLNFSDKKMKNRRIKTGREVRIYICHSETTTAYLVLRSEVKAEPSRYTDARSMLRNSPAALNEIRSSLLSYNFHL